MIFVEKKFTSTGTGYSYFFKSVGIFAISLLPTKFSYLDFLF